MKQGKLYYFVIVTILSLCIFSSGCSQNALDIEKLVQSNPDLKLALIKTPGQVETYRLKTFAQRTVEIEGPARNNPMNFEGGLTTNNFEIVFDSEVQGIDSDGNIIEKITIKKMKYLSVIRGEVKIDFDSSKKLDPNDAFSMLIGKDYTIEILPAGRIIEISGTEEILKNMEDVQSNYETARNLLLEASIRARHNVPLPEANNNTLKPDMTWPSVVGFNFNEMGVSSFERAYKLDKVVKKKKNYKAIISMDAIPSVEGMRDTGTNSSSDSPMTDIRQKYSGTMEFDISSGTLLDYQEELTNQWIMVPSNQDPDGPPSVFNMIATRSYDIKKIK